MAEPIAAMYNFLSRLRGDGGSLSHRSIREDVEYDVQLTVVTLYREGFVLSCGRWSSFIKVAYTGRRHVCTYAAWLVRFGTEKSNIWYISSEYQFYSKPAS